MMARPVAGVRNKTMIITLPGSPKGAKENLEAVIKQLPHACIQAAGADSRSLHAGGVKKLEKEAGLHSNSKPAGKIASSCSNDQTLRLCQGIKVITTIITMAMGTAMVTGTEAMQLPGRTQTRTITLSQMIQVSGQPDATANLLMKCFPWNRHWI